MPPAIVRAGRSIRRVIGWLIFPMAIVLAAGIVLYSLRCNNQLDIKHHPREIRPTAAP